MTGANEGKVEQCREAGFDIVFEDSEIVIVNKAAGLATQGGAKISRSLDVELSRYLGRKAHLVHRLDKDTAGLIIVAKDSRAAAKWSALISSGHVRKEYIAVCFGYPDVEGRRRVSGILKGQMRFRGRLLDAVTHFRVECTGELPLPDTQETLSLCVVRAVLETGRMHQIRVHLAAVRCPIVADDKYGDFAQNRAARKLGINRLHLAATALSLPLGGGRRSFEVPLPPHMQRTLSLLPVQSSSGEY